MPLLQNSLNLRPNQLRVINQAWQEYKCAVEEIKSAANAAQAALQERMAGDAQAGTAVLAGQVSGSRVRRGLVAIVANSSALSLHSD
jgi:hypothetical protein